MALLATSLGARNRDKNWGELGVSRGGVCSPEMLGAIITIIRLSFSMIMTWLRGSPTTQCLALSN